MAKNRKNESAAGRFGPAVKALVFCLILGGAALGYVWEKSQLHKWGNLVKEQEKVLKTLRIQNQMRADHLATLCSPPSLEASVVQLKLGLTRPPLSQVIRLVEYPTMTPEVPEQISSATPALAYR